MKSYKINNLLEFLTVILVFSYFWIHNIYLVLIGIIISLYLININFIDISMKSIKSKILIKNVTSAYSKKSNTTKDDSYQIKLNIEDSYLTLVEAIEELGFIPSKDKNEDSN